MEQQTQSHNLTLRDRKTLTMTGVTEVVSFDENAVELRTALGDLLVQGNQLQLKTLSVEGGQVEVTGSVTSLVYEEPRREGGFFRRLLG